MQRRDTEKQAGSRLVDDAKSFSRVWAIAMHSSGLDEILPNVGIPITAH